MSNISLLIKDSCCGCKRSPKKRKLCQFFVVFEFVTLLVDGEVTSKDDPFRRKEILLAFIEDQ